MTALPAAAPRTAPPDPPLLAVESVDVILGRGWRATKVLSGVDLRIWPGEIVGLVGETGSGKTTLARTVVGLVNPARGRVDFDGAPISTLRRGARRAERRRGNVQLIFQDPLRSLDPDLTVAQIVGEGLTIRGETDRGEVRRRVLEALGKVGLDGTVLDSTPGQISGGQRQRVSIARALATEPRLLLCDEPVSALDASNRNYVLRLLGQLRTALGLSIVVISHDLSSLAGIADRVVVLYRGRIVEDGPVGQVFAAPRHPYTALLMASAPSVRHDRPFSPHQLRRSNGGPVPVPVTGPGACVFAARCPFAADACAAQPRLETVEGRWSVACHRREEWTALAREQGTAGRGAGQQGTGHQRAGHAGSTVGGQPS
jgi:oligopeptide/dipeptide ABC transporter ATP-binding protein